MTCAFIAGLLLGSGSHQTHHSILVKVPTGFSDEMRDVVPWRVYNRDRTPQISTTPRGLHLVLPPVPDGWPYQYQWSGVRQTIRLDVARFGRLIAEVPEISKGSYAHFEVGILDAKGKEVKNFKSGSLTEPGVLEFDLSSLLLPAIYTMDLRLIVGGQNSGASVTYRSVKAISDELPALPPPRSNRQPGTRSL